MSQPPEAFADMPMDNSAPARQPVPWVCYAYMAVCISIFLLGTLLGGADGSWNKAFGLFLPAVQDGQWWRILSCHFLHGGVLHVAFNMFVLYSLGRNLEVHLGHGLFLWASVLGALGTALFSMLFSAPYVVMVGASGVIISWAGVMLPLVTRHARKELLFWFAQIALLSLLPGISLAGHAGGAIAGLLCGVALLPFLKGRRGWLLGLSLLLVLLCIWAARPGPVPL